MTSCYCRHYNNVFLFVFFWNLLLFNCIVLIYCGCSVKQKFELKIYCLGSPDLSFTRTSFKLGAATEWGAWRSPQEAWACRENREFSFRQPKKDFGRRQISAQHRESARVTPPLVLLLGVRTSFKIKVRCRRWTTGATDTATTFLNSTIVSLSHKSKGYRDFK